MGGVANEQYVNHDKIGQSGADGPTSKEKAKQCNRGKLVSVQGETAPGCCLGTERKDERVLSYIP